MIDYHLIKRIVSACRDMKLKALDMALSTGCSGSHIGGGFSAMEILASLYAVARITDKEDRDRIIVSKGHCVLALYTTLWKMGLITEEELESFDKDGTEFYGHAHRNLAKGIEFSGGSLGLGISYAVGVAKACKRKGMDNRIYVLVGDGECNEGIVWEALMSMAHFGLDNVTVIVDRNRYQLDGPTEEVMNMFSLEEKFTAFGFDVKSVDGHSVEALLEAYGKKSSVGKPLVIIADTVKAHGISFLENNKMSHQCALSQKKYDAAKEEITAAYENE